MTDDFAALSDCASRYDLGAAPSTIICHLSSKRSEVMRRRRVIATWRVIAALENTPIQHHLHTI
jgi:hypothetical protein